MTEKNKYALILAGGGGTRLWPLSREKYPKQVLKLFNHKSLLRHTIERIKKHFPTNRIYVITSKNQAFEVRKESKPLPYKNILVEPTPKNTALATAFVAKYIYAKNKTAIISSFAADHYIKDEKEFFSTLGFSQEVAARGDYLVTIGIKPTSAHTGYGYIQAGKRVVTTHGKSAFEVKDFKEKPDKDMAVKYVASQKYFWNANINSYKASVLIDAFSKYQPKIIKNLNLIGQDLSKKAAVTLWDKMPSIPIDTAILEKAKNVLVVPGNFSWVDVGDWKTIYSLLGKDKNKNVSLGNAQMYIDYDSSGNLVYADSGVIATLGLKDTIVIKTGDVILVTPKSRSQDVKKIVEQLKKNNKKSYL